MVEGIINRHFSFPSLSIVFKFQTLFENNEKAPLNASLFVFDTYGEYYPSFLNLEKNNPNISFKSYTTNPNDNIELLKIPPFL